MTTREEMETTLVYDHREQVWRFYSTYPAHISRLKKETRATVTDEGGGWVSGFIPVSCFGLNGFKRRVSMSDEQRAAAADRMRRMHEQRRAQAGDV